MMKVWQATVELSPAALASFRRGEDDGLRAVYERYAGPVFGVALGVVGDPHVASEVVQETFLRAWQAAPRYDPARSIAPWLFTIARRVAIDTARSRRVLAGVPDRNEAIGAPPELDTLWQAHQVRRAVARLPDNERELVQLQHFEQLSQVEIGERLSLPLGTVKSRMRRAYRRLANWLEPLLAE